MSVSVIILTMDRTRDLDLCLSSLAGQLRSEDEILVVGDKKTAEADKLVLKQYTHKMPLVYHETAIHGFPRLYNLAIRKSTKDVLIFINDDCEVDANFISSIKRAHVRHPTAVIQGMTHSVPKDNIYVEIMGDNYKNWLSINMLKDKRNRMKTIDNKNVSIPRSVFKKVGYYNETLLGGSEDIEFGVRLHSTGIPIVFDPSIMVYHHERETLRGFINQHIRIAKSESMVDKMLAPAQQVHVFTWEKIFLHMSSACRREVYYLRNLRIADSLTLPLLYILLFVIRSYGYRH